MEVQAKISLRAKSKQTPMRALLLVMKQLMQAMMMITLSVPTWFLQNK